MNGYFSEYNFKQRFAKAKESAAQVLASNRNPELPENVAHAYQDKYIGTESLVNTALAATINVLAELGLADPAKTVEWAQEKAVTISLNVAEKCDFIKKETRVEKSKTAAVVQNSIIGTSKAYTETTIDEWFWKLTVTYELVLYAGSDSQSGLVLQKRSGSTTLKTLTDVSPRKQTVVRDPISANITWLFQHVGANASTNFKINRDHKDCRTPRRNPESDKAFAFFQSFYSWNQSVSTWLSNSLFGMVQEHSLDLSAVNSTGLFCPVFPFMEESSSGSVTFLSSENKTLLDHQIDRLKLKAKDLASVFPEDGSLITTKEAVLGAFSIHLQDICGAVADGLAYFEHLLQQQLIAAIGKHVGPKDVSDYLHVYTKKFFKPQFQPSSFCFPIRRPAHVPEGVISIECANTPIETTCFKSVSDQPMYFTLDAATRIAFTGARYLHGYLTQSFSDSPSPQLTLSARARQFSLFILMLGKINGPDSFEPLQAIIIQNKDDVMVPLLTETIPSAKAFKEAISSLSPEQQRFAKAFRSMQLESSLFAVAVVQVKPQLEKVLNLDADALTKEIGLTQDLLKLFIEYQIPSDLLSFDADLLEFEGATAITATEKVDHVRKAVADMNGIISKAKEEELALEKQKAELEKAKRQQEWERAPPPPPAPLHRGSPAMSQPPPMPAGRMMFKMASSAPPPPPVLSAPAPSAAPLRELSKPSPAPAPNNAPVPQPLEKTVSNTPAAKEPAQSVVLNSRAYNEIPAFIDSQYERFDTEGAVRPTILKAGEAWKKTLYPGLLGKKVDVDISNNSDATLATEKQKAFDLIDGLTKSGAIKLEDVDLHLVIAATHTFDKTVMETLVQDNVNPIEKIEKSSIIMTSAIHNVGFVDLLSDTYRSHLELYSANLLTE